ncbi:MAG: protein kinase [Roseburia sp.]|nr:protein kinase [Roseburia sp.]MCM1097251.1 protein kinase [Ruminococcus flavefaciens]
MEYEEVRLLKRSEKSTVYLLREKGGERMYIRKELAGQHPIYQTLRNCPHLCLPKLYEVTIAEDSTTVIEEYIEGRSLVAEELTEKQFLHLVRELCSVLEFLHGKGIIHRDIKPSNLLLTEEGRLYLIDFDAARMPKA